MGKILDELAVQDLVMTRDLAVEAGSALTPPEHRGDPRAVLDNARPVMAWLFEGPGGETDRKARWRALRDHLRNTESAQQAAVIPVHPGAGEFLEAVGAYYAAITRGLTEWLSSPPRRYLAFKAGSHRVYGDRAS